jgi:uncharacterized membrane protein
MEQLPEQETPSVRDARTMRVVHVSIQPKSWLGRLVMAVVGVAVMVVAFFASIIAFAIVAGPLAVAFVYLFWVTRHARRALRDQVIDGEVKSRDIH